MFRTAWELDRHVRHHTARLAADRLAVSPVVPATPTTPGRLQRATGLALIHAGERLAARETASARRAARTATAVRTGS